MEILVFLKSLITDYTLRNITIGSAILGIISGAVGSYAVIRKESLMGDAISHAVLPGIVLAFIIQGNKDPLTLILGAIVAGWLGTLLILSIIQTTRIKTDSALGIILSVFFGLGLVLLTLIQAIPEYGVTGLSEYLFGQAATIMEYDIYLMAILGGIVILIMTLFWKELKLLCFDREFAHTVGIRVKALELVLTGIIVIAVVIGLQAVGVILMSAMIVAPASAARQWTSRFGVMIFLSCFFGALSGVTGSVISSTYEGLPTGPVIVICISTIALLSILFANERGIIWNQWQKISHRKTINENFILTILFELSLQHEDYKHGHPFSLLQKIITIKIGLKQTLGNLKDKGMVHCYNDHWALTQQGMDKARSLIKENR